MYSGSWDCRPYYQPCPPPSCAVYIPVLFVPAARECCESMKVPHDLEVQQSTTPQQALVGGNEDVALSLEYLVETGASSPSVTLTTTSGGTSSTWSDAAPTAGYHVQEALLSVKPGTKVTIAVNNVTARVRWCETICC